MKIRTLWESDGRGAMPWLVAAVDEYTEEEHGGTPDFYRKEMKAHRRELILNVPESAVRGLFEVPEVKASVARAAPAPTSGAAPGMTDLMVTPEAIDAIECPAPRPEQAEATCGDCFLPVSRCAGPIHCRRALGPAEAVRATTKPPCDPTEDHNHPADCADSGRYPAGKS